MKALVAVLAGCACMTFAALAWPAPFELEWSAPEGCPSRERMVAASRARLGESESSAPPELFVRGNVRIEGAGAIVVDLQVRDAAGSDLGERHVHLVESSCAAIEEPTAILLAMMIAVARPRDRAGGVAVPPTAGPAGEVPASPAPAAQEPAPRPAVEQSRPRRLVPVRKRAPPSMTLGASAVASVGLLPSPGFGGALRWTVTLTPPIVLGLEGSFETSWAVQASKGEATFRLLDAGALAGFRVLHSRLLEVVPVLEARGGILAGSTTGFRAPYDPTRFIGILGLGALCRLLLGPSLRVEVLPDLRVPLVRDDFGVRDRGEVVHVHRAAFIEARLSLGLAWEFH